MTNRFASNVFLFVPFCGYFPLFVAVPWDFESA